MAFTIEKSFRFDAGHRALGFNHKKEEAFHGHTWNLRLVISIYGDLDSRKTIFDTNDLAALVKPIIGQLDHAFIIWVDDPIYEDFASLCRSVSIDDKIYSVDFNPTLEGIVEHLFDRIGSAISLGGEAVLSRAELSASETLKATYSA